VPSHPEVQAIGGGSELSAEPSTGEESPESTLHADTASPPLDGSVAAAQRSEMARLAAAQRAAGQAGDAAARWWIQLGMDAETAVTSQSLDDLFRSALVAMADVLDAHSVAVLLANETEDVLIARASFGLGEEVDTGLRIRAGEGMAGKVLATRKPLLIGDLSTIAVASRALHDNELHSLVAVPMVTGDRLVGVLHAGSREFDRFTEADVELLEMMGSRLSGAVDRVRSFEAERAARREAERNADRLDRLQKITSALLAASSEEAIASALTETIGGAPDRRRAFWCGVWLRRADGLEPINIALPEALPETLRHVDVASNNPLAEVARQRVPVFITDAAAALNRYPQLGAVPPEIESFAVLPIVLRGECLGAFVVTYLERHRFDSVDREFLASAVDQVALALESVRLSTQARQIAEMSSFLADAAKVLAEAIDLADTLDRLASLAVRFLGDVCLIDVVAEDGQLTRMVARHRDPAYQRQTDRLRTEFPPDPAGHHPAVEVVRTGRTLWSARMPEEFMRSTTRDEEHLTLIKMLGFRSYVSVPLSGDDEILGSVTLVSTTRPYSADDASFAGTLAQQVAAVVDNARRYDSSVRTSHTLQQSLLPQSLPHVPGLRVHTRYLAASRSLEVGGDFYDLVTLPDGRVLFVIGDVAGHDRTAAALMGHLRSAARALAGQVDTPGGLIASLRQSWPLLGFDRIATVLFGNLDPTSGDLLLASAGHYPPLLVTGAGASYLEVEPDTPLGAPSSHVGDWHGTLEPDDLLVLFTDGAIDERNIGSERSMTDLMSVATAGSRDPALVCDRIVDMLEADRVDDVALLALQFVPTDAVG
jgi:GAF domain-containing protein